MLEGYAEFREEADRLLGELADLAERARQPAVAAAARERRRRLAANEFHVAAVSEFSNGKSTLINALLGTDLLPTHRRPLTATVIRVAHGRAPEVRIAFKDGRQALATPGDGDLRRLLHHFTTSLTAAAAEVEEVLVRYPLPLLAHGLVLLDTPGLESVHQVHDRLTRQVLPVADAVLLLVEAGKVGRLADLQLVRHLRFLRQDALFFVVNKVDQLRSPGEVEETVRELRELLAGVVASPRIYPVSALYALQARLLRSGRVTVEQLASDRRLAVPDGDGFRPVRTPEDAAALEAASGLAALEEDLAAYLLSAARAQDALKGATLHVTGRLLEVILPDLRRLRAALQGGEPAEALLARVARCRVELGATRARMDALLGPGGRVALAAADIWRAAVERRLTPTALARVVAALEQAAPRPGEAAWTALDYALKKLCADAARDLRERWTVLAQELGLAAQAAMDEAAARVDVHLGLEAAATAPRPEPPRRPKAVALAAAAVSWPAGLLSATLRGLLGGHDRHLRQAAEEAAARGRDALAALHSRYERAVRERLERDLGETLAALEGHLARLEEAVADRDRLGERLAELTALEGSALDLLERSKALLLRLERALP